MKTDDTVIYIDKKEIDEMVINLAEEIQNHYYQKPLVLICPLMGSVVFTTDLARHLNMPLQIDFVHMTNNTDDKQTIRLSTDISCDIADKHVLIIEEIVDEGRKLKFLKDRLLISNPASIKIVALLDKVARRAIDIKPDFVGKTIEDRFVVGYGMDHYEIGRNYKDIYHLKQ